MTKIQSIKYQNSMNSKIIHLPNIRHVNIEFIVFSSTYKVIIYVIFSILSKKSLQSNILDLKSQNDQNSVNQLSKLNELKNNSFSIYNFLQLNNKQDYRIISRDQWADENLKPNTSDYEQLPLPLSGVIAHHTSVSENRCFTVGKLSFKTLIHDPSL